MSGTARKTLRSTALLTAFEIANPLLSLLLIGTLSRSLGASGLGAYNLLLSFYFVAHSITSLGLNSFITREVSRERAAAVRFLGAGAVLGIAVSAITAAAVTGMIRLADYGADVEAGGWLVGLSLLPAIVILYSESIFIAHEKIEFIVVLSLLENLGKVAVGVWLLQRGFGIVALIGSFAAFRFLTLVLNLALFHARIAPLRWDFDARVFRTLLVNTPVFGAIFIVAALYWRADVLILSRLDTLAAVGYYAAAYRLFAIAQTVPKSFNTSIYPVFSQLFHRSPESFLRANSLSIRYILVALLPIAAGIHGLAEPAVRLLFGRGFEPSVPVLRVVIWTLVPYGVVRVLASGMFASNRQVVDLKVNVMGLAANLILNFALIPRFGALGCAWATLLSILFFLGCQCWFLRGEIVPVLRRAEILRPAAAALVILAWLWLTPSLGLALRIAGGVVVYGALLVLLRVVRRDELQVVLPARFAARLAGGRNP
jgi:O-antigen/teichoic acid export membrane protein